MKTVNKKLHVEYEKYKQLHHKVLNQINDLYQEQVNKEKEWLDKKIICKLGSNESTITQISDESNEEEEFREIKKKL